MAITFKYGAPGPILQAGFAAGVANRQKKQQEDSLEIWQQQNQQQFQAGQAAINRQFQFGLQQQQFGQQFALQDQRFEQQSLQDQDQRAFQSEQAKLGRNFQAEQTKGLIDARSAESGRDREHDLALAGRREQFLRDTATQEGLRSGELELPPEAQNRLRQLESGRVEAMRLDPIQQQEFMDQYEMEKSTLLGLAQPAKQPTIGEQFEQSTIEKGGTLYQRGKDGGFDVLREAPEDTSQADREKYSKLLQAEATRIAKEAGDTEGDLSPYIDRAKKNLAGVGFSEPQQQAQPEMFTGTGDGDVRNNRGPDGKPMVTEQESGASQKTIDAATRMGFKLTTTPEEAAALPAGTRFITPDGRTGTARGKPNQTEERNPTEEEIEAHDRGGKPMAGGQVAPAATQQPTSLLTPKDIAAINAGVGMHDDLVFRRGPDGQTISGSTDFNGNFVPHKKPKLVYE